MEWAGRSTPTPTTRRKRQPATASARSTGHRTAPDAQFSGNWNLVTRQDGHKQWVYKGKPLYRNKNDMKAGDMAGSGVASWSIAAQ
jgi:predicted lipoprotein with Yx(FWY)xxD motif